jgi:hypothetical protein
MTRLSRVVLLLTVALGTLMPMSEVPALADPIGGVIVIPGTGTDLSAIRLRTSAGCPEKANAYYARMGGHGFPPEGLVITANTQAGISHSSGFDVYIALIMKDYAKRYNATLGGRYDITVYCINRLSVQSYGEFTGSLEFTSPTTYQAIGSARPIEPPPPPLEIVGGEFEPGPGASTGSPEAPQSGSLPPPAAQTPVDQVPQASSPASRVASQRGATTQRAPWLVGTLVGVVFIILVIAVVTNQIRKRRRS